MVIVFWKEDFFAGGGVGDGVRLGGGGSDVEDGVRRSAGRTSFIDEVSEGVRVVGVVEGITDAVCPFGASFSVADWLRPTGTGSDRDVSEGDVVPDTYGLSGRERVDVDRESMSVLGRLSFTWSVGLPDFASPATPLVTTWGWTPRKGTSSPRMPIILWSNVTLDNRIVASDANDPPMLCPINMTSRVFSGR